MCSDGNANTSKGTGRLRLDKPARERAKGGAMLMFGIVGVLGIGSLIGARSRTAGPFEGGN